MIIKPTRSIGEPTSRVFTTEYGTPMEREDFNLDPDSRVLFSVGSTRRTREGKLIKLANERAISVRVNDAGDGIVIMGSSALIIGPTSGNVIEVKQRHISEVE